MSTAKMTSKGQITIPKNIRDTLDLKLGDKIQFLVDEQGMVSLIPMTMDVSRLKGIVAKTAKPVTIDAMSESAKATVKLH